MNSIEEKEREMILKVAPDYIQIAEKEVQDLYYEMLSLEMKLKEHPKRFVTIKNVIIDLTSDDWYNILKKAKVSDYQLHIIKGIRENHLAELIKEVKRHKKLYEQTVKTSPKIKSKINELTPELLESFGKMLTINDIRKIFKKEKGIELTEEELKIFYIDHKDIIEVRKNRYLVSGKEYRIATDSGRLEILNNLLTDSLISYNNPQITETQRLKYYQVIESILEQARKEVKGNELKLTVEGKIDIQATLHGEENVFKSMRRLSVNALVIGIVAAKANLKPELYINQLAQSQYKDFNGFNRNILGSNDIVLPSQLIKSYDWENIEVEYNRHLKEMTESYVDYEEIGTSETKETLLERVKRLKSMGSE